jgi:alkyl hydroperoxide reductase subunit AhpC
MACASCGRSKANRLGVTVLSSTEKYPFRANDIQVIENNSIHRFVAADWPEDMDKLLIFVPAAFTPVCEDEAGHMSKWYEEFRSLGCEMILCLTDPAAMIKDWFDSEELLRNPPYKAFSSYLLPNRLNLTDNGRAKRSSVFITKEGEIVKQEHFKDVGRSFEELHRMYWAYTTKNYCGAGWKSPADGFLQSKEEGE